MAGGFQDVIGPITTIRKKREPSMQETRQAWNLLREIHLKTDAATDIVEKEHGKAIYLIRELMERKWGESWRKRTGWKLLPVNLGNHLRVVGADGVNGLIRTMGKDLVVVLRKSAHAGTGSDSAKPE